MYCRVYTLLVSVLLLSQATEVLALEPPAPDRTVQQPAPTPARKSTDTVANQPAVGKTSRPAKSLPEERIQADSAVAFPVDI